MTRRGGVTLGSPLLSVAKGASRATAETKYKKDMVAPGDKVLIAVRFTPCDGDICVTASGF